MNIFQQVLLSPADYFSLVIRLSQSWTLSTAEIDGTKVLHSLVQLRTRQRSAGPG
jgi:hypothetical protein